jgi:pimeloyl-ACP methyl ester carboxylesterase
VSVAPEGIESWWAAGERIPLPVSGVERGVFVRRVGAGPPLTLLHGFPSSSHDFAAIAPALATRHALLVCDFLGFGASDKPADHVYSIHEQANLVQALWIREGVTATAVVAHDYAVSVTQELLARQADGTLATEITAVHFLNGGLYPDLHRPEPAQVALLDPEQGPQLSANLTEQVLAAVLEPTFAPGFAVAPVATEMWRGLERDGGARILHRLIRYIEDRREHEQRWIGALEHTDVPVAFIWGMLDPISGAHVAERLAERLPTAPLCALLEVGHWPPIEAPARVATVILTD